MTVRATEAERTDRCSTCSATCFPIANRIVHVERRFFKSDTFIGFPEMQRRWNLSVLHCQEHLDQTSNPRGCRRVPNIGFYRTQSAKLPLTCIMSERGCKRLDFDRVSQSCTGSVRLN